MHMEPRGRDMAIDCAKRWVLEDECLREGRTFKAVGEFRSKVNSTNGIESRIHQWHVLLNLIAEHLHDQRHDDAGHVRGARMPASMRSGDG